MHGAASFVLNRRTRATFPWLLLLLVAFVLAGMQPAGAAPDDKSYSAAVDLDRVCTSDTVTLTFTFMNTSGTSTQRMRGAKVTAPAGYTDLIAATPVASGGQQWLSSVDGNTVTIVADTTTGMDEGVPPQQSVSVAVTLTAPSQPLAAVFATQADQNSNFGGGGNAFFNVTPSEPAVAAVDCELVLTATPDPVFAGSDVTIDAAVVDSAGPDDGPPVLSFSGTLSFAVDASTAGCAFPESGTTAITAGQGSFILTALSGIGPDDLCTVNGSVPVDDGETVFLTDSVTFEVEGSAALCAQGQALCQTGTETGAVAGTAAVLCQNCKSATTLVADYLEERCQGAEACQELYLADSSALNVPFFIDITVSGIPRGQVTIIAELGGVIVELGSCKQNAAPCIFSVSGSGSTNTWRVLLATDPPIGWR
jgi:hypothetical protein